MREKALYLGLPALALSERMAIARGGGPGVIERLRSDSDPKVIAALLENPRLTEALLAPMASSESTPGVVLALVAATERWANRYSLRLAIAGNPGTPVEVALGLLPGLQKRDLEQVGSDRRLQPAVRRRADLLRGATTVDRGRSGD